MLRYRQKCSDGENGIDPSDMMVFIHGSPTLQIPDLDDLYEDEEEGRTPTILTTPYCIDVEKAATAEEHSENDPCRFSQVFGINGTEIILRDTGDTGKVKDTSPIKQIEGQEDKFKSPILSTFKMLSVFREKESMENKKSTYQESFCGTGFFLSSRWSATALHVVKCEDTSNLELESIHGCPLNPCHPLDFCKHKKSFTVTPTPYSLNFTCWNPQVNQVHDQEGLFLSGSDVCFLEVGKEDIKHYSKNFILPMSPSYSGFGSGVVVFSYPELPSFLRTAKEELSPSYGRESSLWKSYHAAMEGDIRDSIAKVACEEGLTTEEVECLPTLREKAHAVVKEKLLKELQICFGDHVRYRGFIEMVASIGKLISGKANRFCIGINASLANGSCGAAVCSMLNPGYFVAIHSGGGYLDLNIATCTDNPAFAHLYMMTVLSDLPGPSDKFWADWDLEPFYHWLGCHCSSIPEDSPWSVVVKEKRNLLSGKQADSGMANKRNRGLFQDEDDTDASHMQKKRSKN